MLSAFFSSNETALTTVNKIRLRSLADDGNKKAAMVLDITENHTSKMLSAILIGNNIVNISASSLSATLAYAFGGYMVSIATAVLTVAILVFGEITPKNYATINAEKISMRYIRIIRFFMTIMTPVIFIINLFSRGIMFLLRVDPAAYRNATDKRFQFADMLTQIRNTHHLNTWRSLVLTYTNAGIAFHTARCLKHYLSRFHTQRLCWASRNAFPTMYAHSDRFGIVTVQAGKRTALEKDGTSVSRAIYIRKINDVIDGRFHHKCDDPVHWHCILHPVHNC